MIQELESLNILLTELPKQLSHKTLLQCNVEGLINILNDLCKNNYTTLKNLDMEKREKFFESILDKFRPMQDIMKENLQPEKWETLMKQLKLLKKLCRFDFMRKPLMFTTQTLKYTLILRERENELIDLIDKMRQECEIKPD